MPRSLHRRAPGWLGLLGVLATSLGAMGCPGTLDPSLLTGGGGTNGGPGTAGTNGGPGTAGTTGGTGTGGTGGPNCTGTMDGAALITAQCATIGCHDTADANLSAAGLDLTINATIGARLVGVVSPGNTDALSKCGGSTYLQAGSIPTAAGLLIDKIKGTQTCGLGMPYPGNSLLLPAAQQACIEQWAEGLITAAQ